MPVRYQIGRPLEMGTDVRVYEMLDRWEGDARRVLTLVGGPDDDSNDSFSGLEESFSSRSGLSHPNLVRLHGFWKRGGRTGLVSPWLQGPDKVPTDFEELRRLSLQLAEVVEYLHDKDYFVGVLKPSQLFRCRDGGLVLNLLFPTRIMGKRESLSLVRYASPEFLKDSCESRASDLYSLGMVLYELFTGQPPFRGSSMESLRAKQLVATPTRPRQLNPNLSAELEDLILDLIQKDSDVRPSDAGYAASVLGRGKRLAVIEPKASGLWVGRKKEKRSFKLGFTEFLACRKAGLTLVRGVSGIGKTSFVSYCEMIAQIHGLATCRVTHHAGAEPLLAFRDLLRSLTMVAEDQHRELSLASLGGRLVEELRQLSNGRGLFLGADDLQWIDEGEAEIYYRLLHSPDLPICIVGSVRTDCDSPVWWSLEKKLGGFPFLRKIDLGPLRDEETRRLVRLLLGKSLSTNILSGILRDCAGNPFYVQQLIQFWLDQGLLFFTNGQWRLRAGEKRQQVPEGVTQHIRSHLVGLNPLHAKIVRFLAVLDRPAPLEWLAETVSSSQEGVLEAAAKLEKMRLVCIGGSLAECTVRLEHDWIGRVIRQDLTSEQRTAGHRDVAVVLEREYLKASSPFLVERLLDHLWKCGDMAGVSRYLRSAVDLLEKANLPGKAAALLYRALTEGVLSVRDWDTVFRAVKLLYFSGQLSKCLELSTRTLESAGEADPVDLARVSYYAATAFLLRGQIEPAVRCLEDCQKTFGCHHDEPLFRQLKSLLLSALSQTGESQRCRLVAEELKRLVVGHDSPRAYHALCLHAHFVEGDTESAIDWEMKSIQETTSRGQTLQLAGRLINLASLLAGDFSDTAGASKLLRFGVEHAEQIGNLEVQVFARTVECVVLRRRGLDQQALALAWSTLELNKSLNSNRHLHVELLTELARSFNGSLLPELALDRLRQARALLDQDFIASSYIDGSLALGYTWVLLGKPCKALEIDCDRVQWNRKDQGRLSLMRGRAFLVSTQLESAFREANDALDLLPAYLDYYRSRALLLRGEVLLAQGKAEPARQSVEEGLSIARKKFFCPLMARGYALLGGCLAGSGRRGEGRVYCLRALQVARAMERPGLLAELHQVLGRVLVEQGDPAAGVRSWTRALQILKERSLQLSWENRESFVQQHILAIESRRSQMMSESPGRHPRFLQELHQFSSSIRSARDVRRIAKSVVNAVSGAMPTVSFAFLVRRPDGKVTTVATHGKCRRSGSHLLKSKEQGRGSLGSEGTDYRLSHDYRDVHVPFRFHGGIDGILYLESTEGEITEEELDFLNCLRPLVDLAVRVADVSSTNTSSTDAARRSGLTLHSGARIVGRHPRMRQLFENIRVFARADSTVLVYGESGTGKELVARALHEQSRRASGPFLAVNCSALPSSLIESELFGHLRGSFTGANRDRPGLFEAASGGTLFLDEIASMPVELQSRLLRVLEEKQVRRVGDTRERRVNVRIVVAANQPLLELVRRGQFRTDLYYRLNVGQLEIPPLRQRRSDLGPLVEHFLDILAKEERVRRRLSEEALARLTLYDFPGNVRELRNIVESAYHLSRGAIISAEQIESRLESPSEGDGSSRTDSPARRIFEELASGEGCFWKGVRDPFLARDLSRREVREVVAFGLAATGGNYRKLVQHFHMQSSDYRKLLAFLAHHRCKVDFRPFRKRSR